MKHVKWVVGTGALAALFAFSSLGSGATVKEAKALMGQPGTLLLDVRTVEEFEAGHLDGATNIPVQQLQARLDALPAKKDQPIVVYCRSGQRSARATALLTQAGYARVFDLGAMSNGK